MKKIFLLALLFFCTTNVFGQQDPNYYPFKLKFDSNSLLKLLTEPSGLIANNPKNEIFSDVEITFNDAEDPEIQNLIDEFSTKLAQKIADVKRRKELGFSQPSNTSADSIYGPPSETKRSDSLNYEPFNPSRMPERRDSTLPSRPLDQDFEGGSNGANSSFNQTKLSPVRNAPESLGSRTGFGNRPTATDGFTGRNATSGGDTTLKNPRPITPNSQFGQFATGANGQTSMTEQEYWAEQQRREMNKQMQIQSTAPPERFASNDPKNIGLNNNWQSNSQNFTWEDVNKLALEMVKRATEETRQKDPNLFPSSATRFSTADINGPNDQLLGQANSATDLQQKNYFLFFMLLFSIGLNFYLAWLARSFYARYQDLADELRETFTASS